MGHTPNELHNIIVYSSAKPTGHDDQTELLTHDTTRHGCLLYLYFAAARDRVRAMALSLEPQVHAYRCSRKKI